MTVPGSGGHPARAVRHQPQEVDEPPRGGRGRGQRGGPALLLLISGMENLNKESNLLPFILHDAHFGRVWEPRVYQISLLLFTNCLKSDFVTCL